MRIDPRCFECLASRVSFECSLVSDDESRIASIVRECRALMDRYRGSDTPAPRIASEVHRKAYQLIGDPDPFRELKKWNNHLAMEACRRVKGQLRTFRERVLASIIGNTIDYGVDKHEINEDFTEFFEKEMKKGLFIDHTDRMLEKAERVVYLTDNCGEIVFDALVIDYLRERGASIVLVVKGAPILNDATMEDALALGLEKKVRLLATTGSGDIGIDLRKIPPEVQQALEECTLTIAKGMANYESLNDAMMPCPVAFMMAVKCDVIAESVGVPTGSYIALLRE